jgi:hypothetical protein
VWFTFCCLNSFARALCAVLCATCVRLSVCLSVPVFLFSQFVLQRTVLQQGLRCAANFYKKLYIPTLQLQRGNVLCFVIRIRKKAPAHSFIISSSVQRVLRFVFVRLHSCRANTGPCTVSYPLFVRRNFVVFRRVFLTDLFVPPV